MIDKDLRINLPPSGVLAQSALKRTAAQKQWRFKSLRDDVKVRVIFLVTEEAFLSFTATVINHLTD